MEAVSGGGAAHHRGRPPDRGRPTRRRWRSSREGDEVGAARLASREEEARRARRGRRAGRGTARRGEAGAARPSVGVGDECANRSRPFWITQVDAVICGVELDAVICGAELDAMIHGVEYFFWPPKPPRLTTRWARQGSSTP